MRWTRMWAVSALAVVLGMPAGADDPARGTGKIEDPARVGQPGERTRAARETATGERELSGTVVKTDATTLYLEHMGAIVPLKIDEKTRFSGEGVKSSRDLTEGQEVRASFTVEDETTNVASRVAVASGAPPASGTQGIPPEALPPGQHPQLPPERGPGMPPGREPVPHDPGSPTPGDPGAIPGPKY